MPSCGEDAIQSGKTSNRQHDRECQQNQAAPCETAQTFSPRRRFNPGVHNCRASVSDAVRLRNVVTSLQPITIHDLTIQSDAAIIACASINLSYKARKPSESTRAPPMIGMKFVSPVQRGTMWTCK